MITKLAVELVFGFAPLAAPAINRHYRLLGLHTVWYDFPMENALRGNNNWGK